MGSVTSCCNPNDAAAAADTAGTESRAVNKEEEEVIPTGISEVNTDNTPANRKRASSVYFDAVEFEEDMMEYAPATVVDPHPRSSIVIEDPNTLLKPRQKHSRRGTVVIKQWLAKEPREVSGKTQALRGYPGELTPLELEATLEFRKQLKARDPAYREMVDCFKGVEEEPYALCRFMRGNKFVVEDVFDDQLEASIQPWNEAKAQDFYPTVQQAVQCPPGVFLTQYPFFYYGNSRSGCPVQYLKAGQIMAEGVECVTDLTNIQNYTWYAIMHRFKGIVGEFQKANPDLVIRCEAVSIIDLQDLGRAQLNQRTLDVMKQMVVVTNCFPEMLNRMVVVNAPYFFALTWPVIKTLMDPRTAQKIEIYSNTQKASKRLQQLVDPQQLLKDVGGSGPSFEEVARKEQDGVERQVVQLVTQDDTVKVELKANETATISVYTRSTDGGECTLKQDGTQTKVDIAKPQENPANDDSPTTGSYCTKIGGIVNGPSKLTIRVKAKSTATTNYFLVYVEISKKQ